MSNDAITWAFRQDLPSGPKFVLVVLADKADQDHSCYPGQELIARRTGMAVRTVRSHLAMLETEGLIERRHRFRTDGTRTSDLYVLPVEGLPAEAPLPEEPAAKSAAGLAARNGHDQRPDSPGNPKGNPTVESPDGLFETPLRIVTDEPRPKKRERARDPLFDAIVEVCCVEVGSMTATSARLIGKTRRELVAAGATPDEVRVRAEVYRRKFRGADLTPLALAKHWPSLTPPPAPTRDSWLEGYR